MHALHDNEGADDGRTPFVATRSRRAHMHRRASRHSRNILQSVGDNEREGRRLSSTTHTHTHTTPSLAPPPAPPPPATTLRRSPDHTAGVTLHEAPFGSSLTCTSAAAPSASKQAATRSDAIVGAAPTKSAPRARAPKTVHTNPNRSGQKWLRDGRCRAQRNSWSCGLDASWVHARSQFYEGVGAPRRRLPSRSGRARTNLTGPGGCTDTLGGSAHPLGSATSWAAPPTSWRLCRPPRRLWAAPPTLWAAPPTLENLSRPSEVLRRLSADTLGNSHWSSSARPARTPPHQLLRKTPEAPILVALGAHVWPKFRATPAPDLGPAVPPLCNTPYFVLLSPRGSARSSSVRCSAARL